MASSDAVPPPQVVEYDRITGVPSEFNDFLPKCAYCGTDPPRSSLCARWRHAHGPHA